MLQWGGGVALGALGDTVGAVGPGSTASVATFGTAGPGSTAGMATLGTATPERRQGLAAGRDGWTGGVVTC